MDKYKKCECIGYGGFGSVYMGTTAANEVVALKEMNLCEEDEGVPVWVLREISFLKELEHDNIVRLLDVVNDEKRLYLVLECMSFDLKKYMETSPATASNPRITKRFLHQILSGLTYCHAHKILHRDLKPSNVLVDILNNTVKLADFGSARTIDFPRDYTPGEKVATLWYKAPELILGSSNYSTPADIWSVGCIFAEMLNQKPLFAESLDLNQLKSIFRIMGTPSEENWPGVTSLFPDLGFFGSIKPLNLAEVVPGLEFSGLDLLSKMLCLNPSRRVTASDALNHAYFKDI